MKVFTCLVVALVGISAVPNVNSQICLADDIQKNTEFKYKARNLYKGLTIFTANFLDAMHKANPNENLFFSPFSLYHALLLAYFGSANQTEKGLKVRISESFLKAQTQSFHSILGSSSTALGQRQVRCLQGVSVREAFTRALRSKRFRGIFVRRPLLFRQRSPA